MLNKSSGELVLCGALSPLIAYGLHYFYGSPSLGQLIIALSLLFLMQTLLRDIWLYYRSKHESATQGQTEIKGFCVETTVGVGVLLLGFSALFFGRSESLNISLFMWWVLAIGIMILCYLLKDYVFSWSPWRIYKDPDHSNLLFRIK